MKKPDLKKAARLINQAAGRGRLAEVRDWLKKGVDVEVIDPVEGFTPLISAAAAGHLDIVRLLLVGKAKVDARAKPLGPTGDSNATALIMAATNGHAAVVAALLEHGADINANLNRPGPTAIGRAAANGNIVLAKTLKGRGAELPGSVLYRPVWDENVPMVEWLIGAGADVNCCNASGEPLIVTACSKPVRDVNKCAQLTILRMILAAGADCDRRNRQGATALMLAIRRGNTEPALLLVEHGADVNASGLGGTTALHIAAQENDFVVAKALLDHGAKLEVRDDEERTPEAIARSERHLELSKLLSGGVPAHKSAK